MKEITIEALLSLSGDLNSYLNCISKPYANSIALVKEIVLPIVLENSIGIFIFVYILRNVVKLNKEQ